MGNYMTNMLLGGAGFGDQARNDDHVSDGRRAGRDPPAGLDRALNLICERLEDLSANQSRIGPTRAVMSRQKPISLPSLTRTDGVVTSLSFYTWLAMVQRIVDELGLEKSYVLFALSSDKTLLPSDLRQLCRESNTLAEALQKLADRCPPKSSIWPVLVGTLCKATNSGTSHEEIVDKCGELLSSLGHMKTLFPTKDLSRVQALTALLKVGNAKDVQSGLLEEIELMDYRRELPEAVTVPM